jgi:elongator complex protein 3
LKTNEDIQKLKRMIAGEDKTSMPTKTDLIALYREFLAQGKISQNKELEKLLLRRSVRTISGIAPITVLTKAYSCPGKCVYCPTEVGMPKSYLSNEPAAARAVRLAFDPYNQVYFRLQTLFNNGHPVDKLELIVKGGTWGSYPWPYELWFIRRCYEAANAFQKDGEDDKDYYDGKDNPNDPNYHNNHNHPLNLDPSLHRDGYLPENLKQQEEKVLKIQEQNETAACRIIGLTLETRPDWIDAEKIKRMRLLGATRVEVGVQHTDDEIQKLTKRGHTLSTAINAAKLLRDAGFKVDFHTMPQLPGSTPEKDFEMYRELFANPGLRPDMIKVYPCSVVKEAELYSWFKEGKFTPYPDEDLIELLIRVKSELIPRYVRISRLIRDIPSTSIMAGNRVTNLREVIQEKMAERGLHCKCLRCREVGHQPVLKHPTPPGRKATEDPRQSRDNTQLPTSLKMFNEQYEASEGIEHFLSMEDEKRNIVYAFCRLRLPLQENEAVKIFPELQGAAFIRELHTYGHLVPLGNIGEVQHTGLGKQLMERAEGIARAAGFQKMAVIAGVGVREYYRKLGYCKQGTYMVKPI